ncbi:MAG: hypothetical protein NVS4B6_05990 [Mycobacterium sp.]
MASATGVDDPGSDRMTPGTDWATVGTVTAAFATGCTTFIVGPARSLDDDRGLEPAVEALASGALSFESAAPESKAIAAGAVPAGVPLDDADPESAVTVEVVDCVLDRV